MKKVEMFEASDGRTFRTEDECVRHEKQGLLESRLAFHLEHRGTFDKRDAERLAAQLVRHPRNLKAVLDTALRQEIYVAGEPMDDEVVFVVAFKLKHGNETNEINHDHFAVCLASQTGDDPVTGNFTILDVMAGGVSEEG